MLKVFAIFTLGLSFVAYAHGEDNPPTSVPRQATNPPAPTVAVATQQPPPAEISAQSVGDSKAKDEPRTVRIILPSKDKYDYWAFGINAVLAGVGILGIGVGICTLHYLRKQAQEMQRQRILMRDTLNTVKQQTTQLERQVKASHDGLRAWIGLDVRENEFPTTFAVNMIDQVNGALTPRPPQFVWGIKNYGQTPAFIKKMGAHHTYTETANLDTMPAPVMRPIIDFIGAGMKKENPLAIETGVHHAVETRSKFWRVVIKVEYLDAFDETQVHETMVTYHYHVPSSDNNHPVKKGFYQEIDPATNYNT